MHVAYLADGHNYHVKKWIRALCEAGMDVTLITFRPPDEDIPGARVVALPIRIRARRSSEVSYSYFNFMTELGRVKSIVRDLRPDILLGSYATHYGWLAARTNYHPFVLQTWTFDLTTYPFNGYKRAFFGPVVRYALKRADLITTDGPALRHEATRLYPHLSEKFVSVRWGIRLDHTNDADESRARFRAQHGISESNIVVTSPRGLLPVYRPDAVLSELKQLVESNTNVVALVLTLSHSRTTEVQEKLDALRDTGRAVVIDKFLSTEEMGDVWDATDIVISVPSTDGISESLLESMHRKAYPVLSDIPSNRSLIAEGIQGTIVPEPIVGNLTSTVENLLANDSDNSVGDLEMARQDNREWVKNNADVARTAAEVREHLESLIARIGKTI